MVDNTVSIAALVVAIGLFFVVGMLVAWMGFIPLVIYVGAVSVLIIYPTIRDLRN